MGRKSVGTVKSTMYVSHNSYESAVSNLIYPFKTYLKKNVFWPDVEDYIGLSLQTAHEVNPDAILGVNDYKFESKAGYGTSGGWIKEKGICMYNLTKALMDDGMPIQYVGSQSHIDLRFADFDGFTDSVKEYSKVGLTMRK